MAIAADFISRYRTSTTLFLTALNELLAARQQYDALDYGNTLTDEDFTGANADLTKADLVAAVGSVEAIAGFVDAGHDTNLYKLKT